MTAAGALGNGGAKAGTSSGAASSSPSSHPRNILNINVGVLGHVDSGKTSLVKTLSTLLSTASLDKSAQSRQRGITLDLGFSAFLVPDLPPQLRRQSSGDDEGVEDDDDNDNDKERSNDYDCLQVTLVDCPGHASLIRTIIGGAQIIDMVLLVVDATKGIQTQTAECLVIAEMTTTNLVVALNKVDMFPEAEREKRLENVKKRVRAALVQTRHFADAPMVGVSAAVGGEKAAALSASGEVASANIDGLLDVLKSRTRLPRRGNVGGPFYFAIDHCFPIKGQGTVITGTVLSGSARVNDVVQFPQLGSHVERKVKSVQMFRRQVSEVRQGDRCGICLASLDAKLIERGVAATPGAVSLIDCAIAVVRKVRYFRGKLTSDSKFHLSVGHTTVMATAKFFGAGELAARLRRLGNGGGDVGLADGDVGDGVEPAKDGPTTGTGSGSGSGSGREKNKQNRQELLGSASLGGTSVSGLPRIPFDFSEDFVHQDEMVEDPSSLLDEAGEGGDGGGEEQKSSSSSASSAESPLHWAVLTLQTPVYCPLDSLVIGSRLDTDIQANTCRLAFSGRLIDKFDPKKDSARLKIYTWKEKQGVISRLGDAHKRESDQRVVRYELYGNELFKRETNMSQFVGMKVQTDAGDVGVIHSSFGTSGKFRVNFPGGTEAREGDKLYLRFKRYANDPKKGMHQDGLVLPEASPGTKLAAPVKKGKREKAKKHKGSEGKNKQVVPPAQSAPSDATTTSASSAAASNSTPVSSQDKGASTLNGEIASVKGDVLDNGKHSMAIVAGFFTPEINVREKVGMRVVIPDTGEEGAIAGPFGKAGKCKVIFEKGVSASEGTKAQLLA